MLPILEYVLEYVLEYSSTRVLLEYPTRVLEYGKPRKHDDTGTYRVGTDTAHADAYPLGTRPGTSAYSEYGHSNATRAHSSTRVLEYVLEYSTYSSTRVRVLEYPQ